MNPIEKGFSTRDLESFNEKDNKRKKPKVTKKQPKGYEDYFLTYSRFLGDVSSIAGFKGVSRKLLALSSLYSGASFLKDLFAGKSIEKIVKADNPTKEVLRILKNVDKSIDLAKKSDYVDVNKNLQEMMHESVSSVIPIVNLTQWVTVLQKLYKLGNNADREQIILVRLKLFKESFKLINNASKYFGFKQEALMASLASSILGCAILHLEDKNSLEEPIDKFIKADKLDIDPCSKLSLQAFESFKNDTIEILSSETKKIFFNLDKLRIDVGAKEIYADIFNKALEDVSFAQNPYRLKQAITTYNLGIQLMLEDRVILSDMVRDELQQMIKSSAPVKSPRVNLSNLMQVCDSLIKADIELENSVKLRLQQGQELMSYRPRVTNQITSLFKNFIELDPRGLAPPYIRLLDNSQRYDIFQKAYQLSSLWELPWSPEKLQVLLGKLKSEPKKSFLYLYNQALDKFKEQASVMLAKHIESIQSQLEIRDDLPYTVRNAFILAIDKAQKKALQKVKGVNNFFSLYKIIDTYRIEFSNQLQVSQVKLQDLKGPNNPLKQFKLFTKLCKDAAIACA